MNQIEIDALRARLEETERERDDYHRKAIDIADQRDGFRDRAEAAERNMDTWRDQAQQIHNERSALQAQLAGVIRERDHARERQASNAQQTKDERHRRAVAETALEKAREAIRAAKDMANDFGTKPGRRLEGINEILSAHLASCPSCGGLGWRGPFRKRCRCVAPPAEPVRTPEGCKEREQGYTPCVLEQGHAGHHRNGSHTWDRVAEPLRTPMTPRQQAAWDKLEAMAARAESAPEPLRTEAQCMTAHHPSQAKECASCQARALRTEGAPKRCGHIICASIGAEPCLVEGAPKQEEADEVVGVGGIPKRLIEQRRREKAAAASLPTAVSGWLEALEANDSLRAQVERLEKALREAEKALRWTCDYAKAIRDWDGSGTCTLAADVKEAYREVCAALAPEAPVEKGEGT